MGKALADADCSMVKTIHERGSLTPASPLLKKCPIGLTSRQAIFIAAICARQNSIISYAEIAELFGILWGIQTTKVAVREYTEKLKKRDFFLCCELAREGVLQGMKIIFQPKCCKFLRLPPALPHTSAHAMPHAIAVTEPHTPSLSADRSPTPSPPQASLLQEKKKREEEMHTLSFSEKDPKVTLMATLNSLTAEQYKTAWPTLVKVGFDFTAFKSACKNAPDKTTILETWQQSLDYAEYAWRTPQSVRDAKGEIVRTPHIWIAGCFRKNSHYPRPANFKTPEELAQEERLKEEQKIDEMKCQAAYRKWRVQQTDADIAALFECRCPPSPPEGIIEQRFQRVVWPRLKIQEEPEAKEGNAAVYG